MLPVVLLPQPHIQAIEIRRRENDPAAIHRELAPVRNVIPVKCISDQYLRLRPHTLALRRVVFRRVLFERRPCIRHAHPLIYIFLITYELGFYKELPGSVQFLVYLSRCIRVEVFKKFIDCFVLLLQYF